MTCDALLVFGASCFRSFFHDFHDVLLVLFWVMAPLSRFVIWIRFSTLDVESTQKWKRISWLPGWTGVKTQIDYVAITSLWLYMCCISFVFTCGLMRIPCKQKKYCTKGTMRIQSWTFSRISWNATIGYWIHTTQKLDIRGLLFSAHSKVEFPTFEQFHTSLFVWSYLWILLLVVGLLVAEILHYL